MRGRLVRTLLLTSVGLSAAVFATGRIHAEGYGGVSPGSNAIPDGIAAQPGEGALVTWPGFQMLPDGGSRVFVQTSIAVTPELKGDGRELDVLLRSVSLPRGNARRPLDTSFFNTPVKTVRAKPRKGGVVVEIELKTKVSPSVRTEKAPTGYYFVYLDFPAGNYR